MLARSRPIALLLCALALAACGTVVSIEGPADGSSGTTPDEAADSAAETTPDATTDRGGPADAGADADACVATGTLSMDPSYPPKTIPIVSMRAAAAPGGGFFLVGRSMCADGGELGLEQRSLDAEGAPTATPPRCFVEGTELLESLALRPGGGWLLGSTIVNGPITAVLRTLDGTGAIIGSSTRPGDYHQLAVPVGGAVVWSGYRSSPPPDGAGFLGLAPGTLVTLPGERVVAAGARGSNLFALVLATTNGANPTVQLRKYLVGAAATEDVAARSSPVALAPSAMAASFDGLQGLLVEGTSVTAALPVPGAIAVYTYVDGTGWSPKGSVNGLANPSNVVRSCDGSLMVTYAASTGGYRLARFVEGNAMPTSDILLTASAQPRSVLPDAKGRLLVFQGRGLESVVARVLP